MGIKSQGIQLGLKPKIKIKAGLTRAKGEVTLRPTDVEKLYTGVGKATIWDVGKVEIRGVPKKVKIKAKIKPREPMEALQNILVGEIGKRPFIKKVAPDIVIKGKERIYRYKALSDIYGKAEAKRIMRVEERGFIQAIIPEEIGVRLGPPGKPIVFAKLPPKPKVVKPPKVVKAPRYEPRPIPKLVTKVIPEKAAAQISAELTAKIIGRKVVPKVRVKVTPVSRVVQLLAPAVVPRVRPKVAVRPRVVSRGAQRFTQLLGPAVKLKPVVKVRVKVTPIIRVAQLLAPAVVPRVRAVPRVAPRVPPIPPTPIISTIIIPPFIKKETAVERRRRRRAEAKARAQQRAYQASIGSVVLGITAPKITRERFTGLGLRPMIARRKPKKTKKSNYLKRIERAFR
ncbi:hypothetical protein ES702_01235 [subsurface metagenome]